MATNLNGVGYPVNYLPYQTKSGPRSPFLADQPGAQNLLFNSNAADLTSFTSQTDKPEEKKGGFLKKAVLTIGAVIGTVALVKTGKSGKVGKLWKEIGKEAADETAKQLKKQAVKGAAKELGQEFIENLKFWKWFSKGADEVTEQFIKKSDDVGKKTVKEVTEDIPKGCELVHTGENGLRIFKTVDGAYVTQYGGQTGINYYGTSKILGSDDLVKVADNNLPTIVGDNVPVAKTISDTIPEIPGAKKASTVVNSTTTAASKSTNLIENMPKSLKEVPALPKTPAEARAILGVSENASPEEIKKSYRALAKMYHSDINGGNQVSDEVIKVVNAAHDILTRKAK